MLNTNEIIDLLEKTDKEEAELEIYYGKNNPGATTELWRKYYHSHRLLQKLINDIKNANTTKRSLTN